VQSTTPITTNATPTTGRNGAPEITQVLVSLKPHRSDNALAHGGEHINLKTLKFFLKL